MWSIINIVFIIVMGIVVYCLLNAPEEDDE